MPTTEWSRPGVFYPSGWTDQSRSTIELVEWRPRGFRAEDNFIVDKLDRFCIDHYDDPYGIDIENMNESDRVTHWYGLF